MLSNRLWLSCVLPFCLSVLSCGGNKISEPQPVEPDTPNEREEQVAQTAPSDTLALDFIIDGGIGNKRDDRVISGQVSGQGKKIAIEVFAIVNRPFLGAYIKFDFDSNILTYSKIENNVFFNAFIASANESILSVRDEQPKVRLPSSGFLARVEFVTKVNVTQEFTIALSQVAITYGPPEDFDIFIPTTKKVITFNKG